MNIQYPTRTSPTGPGSRWRCWRVAVRPFAYPASVVPVLLGTTLARVQGYPLQPTRFLLALCGMLCLHTGGNLLNDRVDYRRGVDRKPGPGSGAVVRGWISHRQAGEAAVGFMLAGMLCALVLAWLAGPLVLLFGLFGLLAALTYTRTGWCWKYAGLGDGLVFVTFGLLPVLGAYWVQTGRLAWSPILWSLPTASLTVAILHANNWRDCKSDAAVQCRTLAGRLGPVGSRGYYALLILFPFAWIAVFGGVSWFGGHNSRLLPGVGAVWLAFPATVRLIIAARQDAPAARSDLDARTAALQSLFGLLLLSGLWVSILLN